MNSKELKDKLIAELVEENYVHAFVLHYFGIRFDEYPVETLEEVCKARGLRLDQVIKELEQPSYIHESELPLITYPVDLILEYLKHAHYLFIKHKLPYIATLVDRFTAEHPAYALIEKDLKTVFPLFVADFIQHIYEEEDTLFTYIRTLDKAAVGKFIPTKLYYQLEKCSIHKFAMEHEVHDDEMRGIRKLTRDYSLPFEAPLPIKVLYNELKSLEHSLKVHARIENEILFPKAMMLENKVRQLFEERTKLN